jgi:hypothetical protein
MFSLWVDGLGLIQKYFRKIDVGKIMVGWVEGVVVIVPVGVW